MWRHLISSLSHIMLDYTFCINRQSFVRIDYYAEKSRIRLKQLLLAVNIIILLYYINILILGQYVGNS